MIPTGHASGHSPCTCAVVTKGIPFNSPLNAFEPFRGSRLISRPGASLSRSPIYRGFSGRLRKPRRKLAPIERGGARGEGDAGGTENRVVRRRRWYATLDKRHAKIDAGIIKSGDGASSPTRKGSIDLDGNENDVADDFPGESRERNRIIHIGRM